MARASVLVSNGFVDGHLWFSLVRAEMEALGFVYESVGRETFERVN
jgi:hypothetical protein